MEKTETPRDINDMSTPRCDDLAYKLWGQWSKPGEIEAFDLARQLERELAAAQACIRDAALYGTFPDNEWSEKHSAAIDAALNESRQKGEG